MEFSLYLEMHNNIPEEKKQYVAATIDGRMHNVKFTTNELSVRYDRYSSDITDIRNTKVIFDLGNKQILTLSGSIGINFHEPFGGKFYCVGANINNVDFDTVQGYECRLQMCSINDPITSCDYMKRNLNDLSKASGFVYNLGQYDEFVDLFNYYKTLSSKLSNNTNLKINAKSEPYYLLPIDAASNVTEGELKEIVDQNGLLKGYKIRESELGKFKNEVIDECKYVFDVFIDGSQKEISLIRKVGLENVYLSNFSKINEHNQRDIRQFAIENIRLDKNEIILTGSLKKDEYYDEDYLYLNIYDMGQEIKVDSIDRSLKLINIGSSGSATELLEYLIGDAEMPSKRSVSSLKKEKYMLGLNYSQRKAFLKAIDGSPVTLIKGPPGTGKTHVINAIVQYIIKELGEKVIISSQTHIAIDNVLDKLMENYDLIIPNRITNRRNKYSVENIDRTIYKTWGKNFYKHNENASNKKLAASIAEDMKHFKGKETIDYSEEISNSEYSVIGATTTTSAIAGRKGTELLKGYNWLIIDEVSKCPITEVLRYLPYIEKIIMVGDDFQLAPLLEFDEKDVKDFEEYDEEKFARLKAVYTQSVFSKVLKKAETAGRLEILDENYRSVKQVLDIYNVFYNYSLIGKREDIKPEKVHFTKGNIDYESKDAIFIEVEGGQEAKDGDSRFNTEEIKATEFVINDLINTTINPKSVSVSAIFPYAAQISHFQKQNLDLINKAKKHFKSFEIDTVDAFQGKETDIVLVNTVVTDATKRNFLSEFRRINVSLSRARDKLIIFGNNRTLSKINMGTTDGNTRKYFADIIEHIRNKGTFIVYKGGAVKDESRSKNTIKIR